EIARTLLAEIEPQLRESLALTLDEAVPREISRVEVTIETNLGESRQFHFESIAEAIEFLENFDDDQLLLTENDPAMWNIETTDASEPTLPLE
ncbi:MAG TPA: hypothetical protein VF648_01200, partial [Pyrinomonadaceae bacterium]